MSLVRMIARPMLASIFVVQGAQRLRDPEPGIDAAATFSERFGPTLRKRVPQLPTDPKTLVRINAGVQIGAGLALATGRMPRLASLALLGSLLPTTWAGHPFWTIEDPEKRNAQRVQAMKNVGLAGGLMLAAVDTEGKPGLSWRARRAAKDAKRATRTAKREAKLAARATAGQARAGLRSVQHRVTP
ncbi:DoxX family protein [Jiangella rhizosphaerae]|uniref:DoxX family protein n=1 Tax=Jiangella rhizosphaerae TaxID=2293569 RepID=A0A418KQZ8_9ACTN|nr:DoxX family protein [Jiangella rhizosphaerae]RIQ23752.1 DoxX family protein [Jiangella rhizosphaerae]